MNFETENIEFKSQFTEEIYQEVIAFANTDGGTIYLKNRENTPASNSLRSFELSRG